MISSKHIKLFLFLLLIPFKVLADNSVGTPTASVDVTSNGAATYNLDIEIPNGGGFHPQIGLAYNSQSAGYGNAGYGFNITGISVITSGGRNIYYDGQVKGAEYLANSSFYLDGKRLILESGTEGKKEAIYTIEGDPYTKVNVDGYWDNSSVSLRFEVVTQDGTTYRYGYNDSSRLTFSQNGKARCSAWYIDEAVDKYNNIIYYRYTKNGLSILPKEIIYGINSHSRGIECKIKFDYSDIITANQSEFYIGGNKGKVSKKLSTITSTITNSGNTYTYRKYTLGYSNNIDSSSKKYTRLTSITESNAQGDSYAPVKIDWNALQTMNIIRTDKEITGDLSTSLYKEKDPSFFALDINGDGISDIIKQSFVQGKVGAEDDVRLYVYDSQVDKNGNVSFLSSAMSYYTLGNNVSFGAYEVKNNGLFAADIDGDGFNDIVTQYYQNIGDERYKISFQVAFGRSADEWGTTGTLVYNYPLQSKDSKSPISVNMDIDGDGKDEMIFVENHENSSNEYHGGVVCVEKNRQIDENLHDFYLSFEREPKKIFTGDFNNDGLQDIIVMFEHGHKIYYNNGFNGSYASVFTESNSKENYDSYLEDYQTVQQGDFNGDGFPDFLCLPYADTKIQLYINNRDGSFTKYATVDIPISYKKSSEFSINVLDFDGDGKSDVVYEASWILGSYVQWLRSTGNNFESYRTYYGSCKTEAPGNRVFVGDFNGDGAVELANYGILLDEEPNIFYKDKIHIYNTSSNNASSGNVKSITDGLGIKTSFTYSSATNPSVYTRTVKKTEKIVRIDINPLKRTTTTGEPVNCYTIPLSVVSKMTTSVNNETKNISTYSYADLRIHTAGKGVLGFESFTKNNQTLGTVENSQINEWNTTYWIPKKTTQTVTIGKEQSTKISDYYITSKGNKNYFAYVEKEECTDFDQNKVWTYTSYDTDKGVIKSQEVDNDEDFNMYKGVEYFYSEKYGGTYLPDSMYIFQKHSDDEDVHFVVNTYKYDAKGNVTNVVNNLESSLRLIETYTYDEYGNKLTESVEGIEGSGVKKIDKKYGYDASGRFLVDTQTSPASSHITYSYNVFGDMCKETDCTVSTNQLVTSHTLNGWNEITRTDYPDKNYVEYSKTWESAFGAGYYSVKESHYNAPWKKTVYDPLGREVSTSSVGLKGVEISKETTYDSKGQVISVVNKTGNLTITGTFAYDERGRKLSEELSSGKTTTYNYSKNTISTSTANGTTKRTYDAWGNVTGIIDPLDSYVEYKYYSNGQPSTINTYTNSGSCSSVTFEYDDNGHRTKMVDPDAGTMTYKYAADGTILSQTDARGVTTNYSYDNLGRLKTKTYVDKSGHKTTQTNEYFTEGKDVNRLKSQTYDGFKRSFTYDNYGHVTSETRYVNHHLSGPTTYTIKWAYNQYGQMTRVSYPGTICDMSFYYSYDSNGFLKDINVNNYQSVYSLKSYDGLKLETNTVAGVLSKTVDKDGYPYEYQLSVNSTVKDKLNFEYDKSTGNLLTRCWKNNGLTKFNEAFEYDNMDRLVSVSNNVSKAKTMSISYADNGNILNKSDVGQYTYDSEDKPHAVTSVSNSSKNIGSNTVLTAFDVNGKISSIQTDGAYLAYRYGPDDEKWMTVGWNPHQTCENDIEHLYFGDYERIIEDNDITEYYFLENGVIVISKTVGSEDPRWDVYQAVTDNLGSVLVVYDEYKKEAFRAKYDAWGKQTVYTNKINFQYGYTGHEMLPYFDLIDMEARLYDPNLGRFLSCDNYVQAPDNSQSFNRYSYCLNNPLKYTDPDGNIATAAALAIFAVASDMMCAAHNGDNVLKAGLISVASIAATYGIGSLCQGLKGIGGALIKAGAHGLSSGVFSAIQGNDFGSAFVSGFASSITGFATKGLSRELRIASQTLMGGITAWATGGDFLEGAMTGMLIGIFNDSMHPDDDEFLRRSTVEVTGTDSGPYNITVKPYHPGPRITEKGLEIVSPEFAVLSIGRAAANGALKAIGSGFISGCRWLGTSIAKMSASETAPLSSFQYASKYGFGTYKNLTGLAKRSGLQVHHLIEKRFAPTLGVKEKDMLSIVLTPKEHQVFTNAWRSRIPYGTSRSVSKQQIMDVARDVYKDYPEILNALKLK